MAQVVENDIDVAPGEVLVERRIVAAPHNRTRLVAWVLVIVCPNVRVRLFRRSVGSSSKSAGVGSGKYAEPATNSSVKLQSRPHRRLTPR